MRTDPLWLQRLKEEVFSGEVQQWLFRSEHPAFARAFNVMHDWWTRHVLSTSHNGWRQKQLTMKTKTPKEQLCLRLAISRVYFIQESGAGYIKIGTTKNVDARVRDGTTFTPHTLSVLALISGDHRIETTLHKRFAHARIRGEWFRPVPELLAYIAEIKARTTA
jgi:hypothetical protein